MVVMVKQSRHTTTKAGALKCCKSKAGAEQSVSLFSEVLKAQQARVDKGYMEPLERNWKACLAFAYHTQEEAWEIVRELPRR